ncbi:unnamed protein product [Paramecium sonneborni]|uniref:Uncharacterized protein n=1 Tax=Paramecium sonneborni TaxID=65129 RepID=A0A8S1MG79_9CILI|nr:unnamed protein product [Paramecium sonneborni]
MKFSIYCCSPNVKGSRTQQKNDESTMVSIRSISQISLPSISKKKKPWVFQDDYDFLKDEKRIFKLLDDENSPYINRRQQALKLIQQIDYNDPADIEERFSFILKYLKQTRIGNLYNIGVFAFAFVLQINNLFQKAIQVWQKFLIFCNGHRAFKYKMIAYKFLAELYLLDGDLRRSLNYSKKFLKYALCFKEYEYELNAYELIGKIYYYKQESQLAKAFHQKFMEGESLSNTDQIRVQAKKLFDFKIKQQQSLGKIDTDSEEEFEINKLVEPKELTFNPIKVKDVLIKNKHLWGHVKRECEPLGPINRSIMDRKLFQREYYTQLSHNNSLQKFVNNHGIQLTTTKKNFIVIDKLIFDIQQF